MKLLIFFVTFFSFYELSLQNIDNKVQIFLFSKYFYKSLHLKDVKKIVSDKWFDRNKPTVMYIHGYTEDRNSRSTKSIIEAFRKRNDHNILICDWGKYSIDFYFSAVMPQLQKISVKLADRLNDFFDAGYDFGKFYLVGHSLGLDPADPGFYPPLYENFQHISASDAKLVDIIHTSGTFLGTSKITGTTDFYPNGGLSMPGCRDKILGIIENPLNEPCNHQKSVSYFAESINNPKAFSAVKSKSYNSFKRGKFETKEINFMGFGCSKSASGVYYLQTNSEKPYGRRDKGIYFNKKLAMKLDESDERDSIEFSYDFQLKN